MCCIASFHGRFLHGALRATRELLFSLRFVMKRGFGDAGTSDRHLNEIARIVQLVVSLAPS